MDIRRMRTTGLARTAALALLAAFLLIAAFPAAAQDQTDDPDDLDNSFGRHGVLYPAGNIHNEGMALQPDGKIVLVGSLESPRSTSDIVTLRYDDHGRLDRSFAGDGSALSAFGPGDEWGVLPLVQRDGRILSVGWGIWEGAYGLALARFLPNGEPDASLNGDGKLWIGLPIGDDFHIGSALIQPDGKILIAGGYTAHENGSVFPTRFLVRYLPDGRPDTSFGANGVVNHHTIQSAEIGLHVYDIALTADGSIIVAGQARRGSGSTAHGWWTIDVYNSNGDYRRAVSGPAQNAACASAGCFDHAGAVEIQSNGKIVIAGAHTTLSGPLNSQTQAFHVMRFNPDWSPDATFSGDGQASVVVSPRTPGGARDRAYDLIIMQTGRILLGGTSAGDVALARFYGNGTLDTTFGDDGVLLTDLGVQDSAYTLRQQDEEKVLVLGDRVNTLVNVTRSALLRYRTATRGPEPATDPTPTPTPTPEPLPDFEFMLALPVVVR